MQAFVTGSHAYGTPTKESDIDLVVLVSKADLLRLGRLDPEFDENMVGYGVPNSGFLRFGKLNLLAVHRKEAYDVWYEGTQELIGRRPVTRAEAVEVFKRRQKEAAEVTEELFVSFEETE